ncbi:hypothetical protein V5O48_017182 [Marasmius crinis-equi]|uniref:Minor tail protein n=1 Tax=Marasmius crinis-equi TaxID=585013 RepID=A0ABR3EPP6_9AGAR
MRNNGLPTIIAGGIPGFDGTQVAKAQDLAQQLAALPKVKRVDSEDGIPGNTTANLSRTLTATGTPFVVDTRSGEVSPVAVWNTMEDGHIVIPASRVYRVSAPSIHISDADSDSLGAMTSSGVELNITAWTPPTNLSQVESVLVPYPPINLTQGLVPWDQLDGHQNTSGVGTYVTTFDWAHSGVGVQLDFGSVVHTLKAWVNGEEIPTADPTRPVVDISGFVKEGTNTIRVDAASTLLNVILATPGVQTFGQSQDRGALQPPAHYGLVEPVRLIPYARVTVET